MSLGHSLLWSWALDFEDYDHEFLIRVGIVSTIHQIASLDTLAAHARSVLDDEGDSGVERGAAEEIFDPVAALRWRPWSVHAGIVDVM